MDGEEWGSALYFSHLWEEKEHPAKLIFAGSGLNETFN